jgi:DNA-directed RNA polymerase subunit RPC12/RpoP
MTETINKHGELSPEYELLLCHTCSMPFVLLDRHPSLGPQELHCPYCSTRDHAICFFAEDTFESIAWQEQLDLRKDLLRMKTGDEAWEVPVQVGKGIHLSSFTCGSCRQGFLATAEAKGCPVCGKSVGEANTNA